MPAQTRLTTPSRGEEPALVASQIVGGPVGRFAAVGRRGWTYAAAVLSALASVMVALGVAQKNHCIRSGWGGTGALWRECYSDLPVGAEGPHGGTPWSSFGQGGTQPVLTAVLSWIVKQLTPSGSSLSEQQIYFAISAVIIVLLIAATTIATASMLRGTPWLAAHVALSPVLITASLLSFDVLGVALATLGMAAWARRHPVAAGVLIGAATMARTYPLVILLAMVLIAQRDRAHDAIVRLLAGAAGAIVLCIALAYGLGGNPFAPYSSWWHQGAGYGSLGYLVQIAGGTIGSAALSIIAILGWVAAVLTGLYLSGRPVERTRLAPLALTLLVIVMLTGKSVSVQCCLWVLPLLALTATRWRDHLMWAGVEIVYFAMVFMYIAGPSNPAKALPGAAYSFFVVLRMVAYVGIAWASWESADDLPRDPLNPYQPAPPRSGATYVPALAD
ncbi:hypothetical protein [Rudaeicoccus suwonensis]|uniref:Putative membrane protein n=1 Tax=Rudaeicoccus suwonensis TaxID=657409 RepID=A0A561E3X3_9MICO|nr:hypothetical protein [Rudaeicoccus suwonensis]TWE10312.1 putative membrane protein [Rudaeicoccus suwonensis]